MIRARAISALLLLPLGCGHTKELKNCEGLTREQCVWKHARRSGTGTGTSNGAAEDAVEMTWESEGSWTRAEEMLQKAAEWLSDGLGGAIVSAQARKWCAETPTIVDKGHGASWICHVREPPLIAEREFTLEGSARGVLAIAGRDFDGSQSAQVVNLALRRWRAWCADSRFSPIERFQDEEFHSCALPGGPLLVIGRFPQDLEADLWQVSLSVMGAG